MISVIVPVYNEADNLTALYEQAVSVLERLGQPWELIFINDGSTDGSQDKLEELAARNASVKVIKFCRNFGQTAAMMAGVDYAEGHVIIPMDGDLQNDPQDIPRLLEKLEQGFDVVSGWRQDRKDNPINRTLPSRVANGIISYVSGVHLHDYGCSLKAYRKDIIKGIRLYGEMHRFIPIYASCLGARIAEIPVQHHPRQNGVSKYGISRVVKVLLDLLVVKFLAKYSGKPMYLFGSVGVVILAVSLLVVTWALYLKFVEGVSLISTPLPLLGVMAGISGFMCILMGLLAEVLIRTYYEAQGKTVYLIGKTCNIKPHGLQG
ncbi:glycosyltransferase family 2 protein [Pseudogulbenkiania subflava]|uniref:Glycosyl transferase family 2 n=1 Tax=Pseudogulbenkiania subflava DSM 22618 TaxID=1123014 RepID=A0A1Y6BMT1_9NEIS|nr:glycosyltransferase family 2 protein [Pseudogulbenkiania subflava]SMF10937.1 Glycosyl transferase family 2 [Pseudogulbenkiania subflava DSM 22618]